MADQGAQVIASFSSNFRCYVAAAAGYDHTVLLCDDGTAATCGDNGSRQCDAIFLISPSSNVFF